ncbi:hypothetical protein GCM10027418_24500 [Mariniluteicoccus endophyticus]
MTRSERGARDVRRATVEDLPAIVGLEPDGFSPKERWSEAAWRGELEADNRVVLVAGDPVAGVITVQHVGGVADLNRIVVATDSRGRGIGRTLAETGVRAARDVGCDEMLLEVRHDNAPALALYTALGFAEIACRADYYGPGLDAVILRLDLDHEDSEGDDDE